jgi:hypothetical protein
MRGRREHHYLDIEIVRLIPGTRFGTVRWRYSPPSVCLLMDDRHTQIPELGRGSLRILHISDSPWITYTESRIWWTSRSTRCEQCICFCWAPSVYRVGLDQPR